MENSPQDGEGLDTSQPVANQPISDPLAFREVPWRTRHIVLGCLPLIVAIFVFGPSRRDIPLVVVLGLFVFAEVWMLAYPLGVAWRSGWRPRLNIRASHLLVDFLIAGLVLGFVWVTLALSYLVWSTLFGDPPPPNPLEGAVQSSSATRLILLVVFGVIIAPITEEVFFRGMLYRGVRRFTPWVVAILLQAVAFGFLHIAYGPTHAVMIAMIGIALALVYDLRKTLLASILCHGLHNAAVFGWILLVMGWNPDPPALGVQITPHESGVLVTEVAPNSGAEAAGIRPGDVLYSVNGYGVENTQHAFAAIRDKKVGEAVTVEYIRNGQLHRVDVVLQSRRALAK